MCLRLLRSRVALAACLIAAPGAARADLGGEVAVGGGVHAGDPMTALDARADWASDGGGAAIGLGVRLRTFGDGFARSDWASPDDWAAILRYAVVRRDDGAAEVVAGAQPQVTLGDGALIDGVVPAALLDRRATGAHARVRAGRATFEAVVDDVTAPTVIGARAVIDRAAEPSGDRGAQLALEVAGDPLRAGGPFGAVAASGALSTTYREVTDRVELGARAETSRSAGAWIAASTAAALGETRFALRGEVTAGTARDVAAPFGPLDAILRAAPMAVAPPAGLGGAVRLSIDALAVRVEGELRARPGAGGEYSARLVAPAYRDVQLAALVAGQPSRDLVIAGAALRARIGARAFVGVEAARQYDASMQTPRAVWQATAWLGLGL